MGVWLVGLTVGRGLGGLVKRGSAQLEFFFLRMAKQRWLEGLSVVLGRLKNPLATWRKTTPISLKGCGLWACLVGAMICAKLLRCSGFILRL